MTLLYDFDLSAVTDFALGQTDSQVETNIAPAFPSSSTPSAGAMFSKATDGSLHYMRHRYQANVRNIQNFFTPITAQDECYLVYDVMFESGFDFGDSAGDGGTVTPGQRTDATALKLPGLGNDAQNNSGGAFNTTGFSVRGYITGQNDDGNPFDTRDGAALSINIYSNSGSEVLQCPMDFGVTPWGAATSGTTAGCGDPRLHKIETDVWYTLIFGVIHNVATPSNSTVRMWMRKHGTHSAPVEALEKTGLTLTSDPSANGTDQFVFSTFHGGPATEDWMPDAESFARFANYKIFSTEAEAIAEATPGAAVTPLSITSPTDNATDVGPGAVTFTGAVDDNATGLKVRLQNTTDGTVRNSAGAYVTDTGTNEKHTPTTGTDTWSYGPIDLPSGKAMDITVETD